MHGHGHGHDDDVDPSTPYDQRLEELEFLRSACAVAQRGQTDKLAAMLARRPDSVHWDGVEGKSGYTPLHYAAREGHVSCVRLLLDKGAEVNRRTTAGGATALHRAAYCGHVDVCTALLDHGADAKLQDGDGETALHKASTQGHAHAVRLLLSACPEAAHMIDKRGLNPVDAARDAAVRSAFESRYIHELGGPDKLGVHAVQVDMAAGEHKQGPFLKVNPFAKLPALSHGDLHIFESGAVLLYLHELMSGADAAARGRAASWVLFANSTMGNGLYLEHLRPKELPAIMAGLTSTFADGRQYLEPQGFTVGDVAVGGLLLYLPMMFPDLDLTPFPAVTSYMARLAQRPAYKATLGARLASGPAAPPTRGGVPVR